MKTIARYNNGNYTIMLSDDGTKVRENELDTLVPAFPENIDIKLTNWCENPICAKWCHEQSNVKGEHGDLSLGLDLLKTWQPGCECAFGGGSTLSHPALIPFLREIKRLGLISNVTVNAFHFQPQFLLIQRLVEQQLIHGIGCSFIRNLNTVHIQHVQNWTPHLVFHLIIGVHTPNDLDFILDNYSHPKVLLLGYKTFGNGVPYYDSFKKTIDEKIHTWFTRLHTYFDRKDLVLSFDNLAIQQLKLRRFFSDEGWQTFYQGDDGFASMYVDLVKREYAISSRSAKCYPLAEGATVESIFKQVRI